MKTLTDKQRAILALDQARERIREPNAWCKGRMYDDQGRHCMLGAMSYARETLAGLALSRTIHDLGYRATFFFNDDATTTHADVMAAFDLAIERLRDG